MKSVSVLNHCLLAGLLAFPGVAPAESLSLAQFLTRQTQQNYQIWQLAVQQKAQQLGLEVGEEYWKPDITVVSNVQNSQYTTAGVTLGYEQWQTGIESSWTSDIGTNLTLAANWLDGEGLGAETMAQRQQGRDTTLTLSQPLLKNNTPAFRQLDKRLAENRWQQFEAQGALSRLSVQRDSLEAFIEFQVACENWKIQTDLLQSLQHTTHITEQMMQAEKATPYEVDKAQSDVLKQQVEVDSARVEMDLLEQAALATLKVREPLSLQAFASLPQLLQRLRPLVAQEDAEHLSHHPELTQAVLAYDSAVYQLQQEEQALVPDLDLFYQHQKQHFQVSNDVENNTYGVRFSYELTNKSTRQGIETQRANAQVAALEKAQTEKQLQLSYHSLHERTRYLSKQVAVLTRQVGLMKQGLAQQRARYKAGRANFYSLENRQQDVLSKQQQWLAALRSLAISISQLSYYSQADIGQILSANQHNP